MRFPYKTVIILLTFLSVLYYGVMVGESLPSIPAQTYIAPGAVAIKGRETLYFVYEGALYSEQRSIEIEDLNYAAGLVKALTAGPSNHDYKSLFDLGVQVLSVDQIDNICYVNLSKDIDRIRTEPSEDLELYLWAVVNTLTERRDIDFVQFLVEGSPEERQIGSLSFSQALSFNDRFLYVKVRTATDAVRDFLDYVEAGRYDLAYGMLSEASRNNLDYSGFATFANRIRSDYDTEFYFSKRYEEYDEVYVRYVERYGDNELFNIWIEVWSVVREDNVFKIDLTQNLNEL